MDETQGPEIELSSDKTRLVAGDSVTVCWRVNSASEIKFWKSTDLPDAPEPLDWMYISEQGQQVEPNGQIDFSPTVTTSYYLVAHGPLGMSGKRIVIRVVKEVDRVGQQPGLAWKPPSSALEFIVEHPHVDWLKDKEAALKFILRFSPWYAFVAEPVTFQWEILNASRAEARQRDFRHTLVVSQGNASGTELVGSHTTDSKWFRFPVSGSSSVRYNNPADHTIDIRAYTPSGHPGERPSGVMVMPEPRIAASSTLSPAILADRVSKIKEAIKFFGPRARSYLLSLPLHGTSIDAFDKHYVRVLHLNSEIQYQLENLNLITFIIEDVEAYTYVGQWVNYTNDIHLQWAPGGDPVLNYLVCHEFIHKCGFNIDLQKKYENEGYDATQAHDIVENQAHAITTNVMQWQLQNH